MADLKVGKNQKQWNVPYEKRKGRDKFLLEWRHKLHYKDGYPYCVDIDSFEYTIIDNKYVPVAIVEHSIVEDKGGIRKPDSYLWNVNKNRKNQMDLTKFIANKLECRAFYMMVEKSRKIYVRCLTDNSDDMNWMEMNLTKWGKFIKNLRKKVEKEYESNTVQ